MTMKRKDWKNNNKNNNNKRAQSEARILKHFDPNTFVAPHAPHTYAVNPLLTANAKVSLRIDIVHLCNTLQ